MTPTALNVVVSGLWEGRVVSDRHAEAESISARLSAHEPWPMCQSKYWTRSVRAPIVASCQSFKVMLPQLPVTNFIQRSAYLSSNSRYLPVYRTYPYGILPKDPKIPHNLSIYLSIYLSIDRSIYGSTYLSIYVSIYVNIYIYIYIFTFIFMYVYATIGSNPYISLRYPQALF